MTLNAGDTIAVGTCTVPGSSGSGDTVLRLQLNGVDVAFSDDACGTLSYFSVSVTTSGVYTIRQGCFGSGSCSGTVAYVITHLSCATRSDCASCKSSSGCGW